MGEHLSVINTHIPLVFEDKYIAGTVDALVSNNERIVV